MDELPEWIETLIAGTTIVYEGEASTISFFTETLVHCDTSHGRVKYKTTHLVDALCDATSDTYVVSFP